MNQRATLVLSINRHNKFMKCKHTAADGNLVDKNNERTFLALQSAAGRAGKRIFIPRAVCSATSKNLHLCCRMKKICVCVQEAGCGPETQVSRAQRLGSCVTAGREVLLLRRLV